MQILEELRTEINECDAVIIAAMQRRLRAVAKVGYYKKEQRLPVYQPQREQEILNGIAAGISGETERSAILDLYGFIMRQSRCLQSLVISSGRSIALTGYMGSGKSSVGRALALAAGFEFVDTDALIEKEFSLPVTEVFKRHGEQTFRASEKRIVARVACQGNAVISCGGGVVLDPENIVQLKSHCIIVWLNVADEILLERLKGDITRPLIANLGAVEIREMIAARKEFYRRAADITVDIETGNPEEAAATVFERLLGYAGRHCRSADILQKKG